MHNNSLKVHGTALHTKLDRMEGSIVANGNLIVIIRPVNVGLPQICFFAAVPAAIAAPVTAAVTTAAGVVPAPIPENIEGVSLAAAFRVVNPDNRWPTISGRTHELLIATPIDSLEPEAIGAVGHRLIALEPAEGRRSPAERADDRVRAADLDFRGNVHYNFDRAFALASAASDFGRPPVGHSLPEKACGSHRGKDRQTTVHWVLRNHGPT
jgi:hypothetical protein